MNISSIDPQEIARFSKHASHWWDKNGPLKTLHDINPLRLEFILNACSLQNKTILDVGCGGGILSEALARQGAKVTGLDVEMESLIAARQHASQECLDIEYVSSPIEAYAGDAVDVITCMEMLEHVNDPQQIIMHAAQHLKSGGYLFLSTINRTLKAYLSVVLAAEYLLGLLPKQTHTYAKFIKPSELVAMIHVAGFELKILQGVRYDPWSRLATFQQSVDVNYLMACYKP